MSVAKQWRKGEGEGECLTLGLGGWIEDQVRLLHSFIYKNFQVLWFLLPVFQTPCTIINQVLFIICPKARPAQREVLHPGALAQEFPHQNCQHLSLDLTGKNRRSCPDANTIEFNVYILEKYCRYLFSCNLNYALYGK